MKKRSYLKRARAEGEARTRQAVLDAAVACFSETHFDRVTMNQLAQRAGLSVQTLLRIHGTKEQILVTAARSIAAALIDKREEVAPGDLDTALRVLVSDYERWGDTHERLFVRARQLPELAQLFEELLLRHRQWIQRIFARELELRTGPDRARLLALLVVSLDIGTYRRLRVERLSRAATTRALHSLVTAVLADTKRDDRKDDA